MQCETTSPSPRCSAIQRLRLHDDSAIRAGEPADDGAGTVALPGTEVGRAADMGWCDYSQARINRRALHCGLQPGTHDGGRLDSELDAFTGLTRPQPTALCLRGVCAASALKKTAPTAHRPPPAAHSARGAATAARGGAQEPTRVGGTACRARRSLACRAVAAGRISAPCHTMGGRGRVPAVALAHPVRALSMLTSRRHIAQAASPRNPAICWSCAARRPLALPQRRPFSATDALRKRSKSVKPSTALRNLKNDPAIKNNFLRAGQPPDAAHDQDAPHDDNAPHDKAGPAPRTKDKDQIDADASAQETMSLKEALMGSSLRGLGAKAKKKQKEHLKENLRIEEVAPEDFAFEPVHVDMPSVPMLAYGLDRVLFNPGVYRLQDPRTGVYNFDPYLEKIMPVEEFDFDALGEYKTSSKDEALLAVTRQLGIKYTGSTSSMSSVLQHFHFLLSAHRKLDHSMLSKNFPDPANKFSRITQGPDAIFLRYKDGIYAIDADKTYDTPNVMSWLGHSLEKLLTTERTEFERYRRSSPEQTPKEGDSARCFHYSKQGSILMRSQLDAQDPRLPGAGIFDLKTRAVVSIRMNHKEYQEGLGYQLRYAQGEWESFEREFYDMTRATMLKYSLQVRMGRMDGIFLAYHNIERIFGFQYLSLSEMDQVLHGQSDTCLGDKEFKLSIGLMEELLNRATNKFPKTVSTSADHLRSKLTAQSIRLHFETRDTKAPFMYVFAEPVTDERADEIQNTGAEYAKEWARRVIGVGKNDPEAQEAWQSLQEEVDEQVSEDGATNKNDQAAQTSQEMETSVEGETTTEQTETDEMVVRPPKSSKDTTSSGPLMGWTLTVRNKVNGHYLKRPENLEPDDNWQIEYYINEIEEESVWDLYNSVKERRRQLIGLNDDEQSQGLANYRRIIQRYASRGRMWRAKQDQINEERGLQVYKPLGPGSDEYASSRPTGIATPASEAIAE